MWRLKTIVIHMFPPLNIHVSEALLTKVKRYDEKLGKERKLLSVEAKHFCKKADTFSYFLQGYSLTL